MSGGILARMARNRVAANLIMLVLVVGGVLQAGRIQQEVFPEVTLDQVIVTVSYPGASPEDVEEGIVLSIEEAVRGLDGVKEVRATAAEGIAKVIVELRTGTDQNRALSDVKSEVDAIQSFPADAERPIVSLATNRREVVSLMVFGDVSREALEHAAERAREGLLSDPRITQVEISGLPPPEISIEVSQENLRRYGLSLPEIARRVGRAALDVPGGGVDTEGGEVLVRTKEKKEQALAFSDIALIASDDGSRVTLGEVASIEPDYRDTDQEAYYDGKPAARLRVFRVGDETPMDVSTAVRDYAARADRELGEEIGLAIWNDASRIFDDRVKLLLKNAALGVALVILILGLFLDPRLAFWVTLGIPISFLGVFLLMPAMGVSINMISLFAFILTLGIVVDDAIVIGEAVYKQRQEGKPPLEAAIEGGKEVRAPVIFAVLTTITAFTPLLFIPGVTGKFFDNIPLVVIPILALSLVEVFLVLPAHLGHEGWGASSKGLVGWLRARQRVFSEAFERFVERRVEPLSATLVRQRYLTLAVAFGVLSISVGLVVGGRIKFSFFPRIEGEIITASLRLPHGAPMATTRRAVDQLTTTIERAAREMSDDRLVEGIYAEIGTAAIAGGDEAGDPTDIGSHNAYVQVQLVPAGEREVRSEALTERWRQMIGDLAGVDALELEYSAGPPTGRAVAIELSHRDRATLERASRDLAKSLALYAGVIEVDHGFDRGKPQIELRLLPAGRAAGVEESVLGEQVRAAFFGAEALRQQRGRHEVRVYVRRPDAERASVRDIESLMVQTPRGGEIPLPQAAEVRWTHASTAIHRKDARRVVIVTGDVMGGATGGEITAALEAEERRTLLDRYPELGWAVAGEQEERAETLAALRGNMVIALIAMFALMAAAFRSYVQPLVVMAAIPFGLVGALVGHLLLGYQLSIISVLGMVALSGVVVNDSLVLIASVNDFRAAGMCVEEALIAGAKRRFRPILLTSLTTFGGLAPMIFETSVQARFLVPMALSLGFGVLVVTPIALVVVPALYMVIEDARRAASRAHDALRERAAAS
jgi:multidrug efflux pump subunit AcrB